MEDEGDRFGFRKIGVTGLSSNDGNGVRNSEELTRPNEFWPKVDAEFCFRCFFFPWKLSRRPEPKDFAFFTVFASNSESGLPRTDSLVDCLRRKKLPILAFFLSLGSSVFPGS